MLYSGSDDETVRVWRVAAGTLVRTLRGHVGSVLALAISPGSLLASAGFDRSVKLWDVRTASRGCGSCKSVREFASHERSIEGSSTMGLAFSTDGKFVLASTDDAAVGIWAVASGEPVRYLRGHARSVTSLAFSRRGDLLASGSEDGTALLWNGTAALAFPTPAPTAGPPTPSPSPAP